MVNNLKVFGAMSEIWASLRERHVQIHEATRVTRNGKSRDLLRVTNNMGQCVILKQDRKTVRQTMLKVHKGPFLSNDDDNNGNTTTKAYTCVRRTFRTDPPRRGLVGTHPTMAGRVPVMFEEKVGWKGVGGADRTHPRREDLPIF